MLAEITASQQVNILCKTYAQLLLTAFIFSKSFYGKILEQNITQEHWKQQSMFVFLSVFLVLLVCVSVLFVLFVWPFIVLSVY